MYSVRFPPVAPCTACALRLALILLTSASVAGSPYLIRLSKAHGGTFTASNYSVVYINGLLTVLPVSVVHAAMPSQLTNIVEQVTLPTEPM